MKIEEEETIVINRSGRSTYLDEKSVLRNGATPGQRSACYPAEAAAATLRDACRQAMVEIVAFYPATDSWTLTQRTPHGPNTINCRTDGLANTLERLTAGIGR
jgi:hypothetical protein